MTATVEVRRPVNDSEVEAARELTNRSWLCTYAPIIGEGETQGIIASRHAPQLFAAQAASNESEFLVAASGNTIVGHSFSFAKGCGVYIDRLHVAPNLKGGGIGRALLTHTESSCGAGTRLWLEVLEGNDNAVGFYERLGFKQVDRTDACGGLAGIAALIFAKTLNEQQKYDRDKRRDDDDS